MATNINTFKDTTVALWPNGSILDFQKTSPFINKTLLFFLVLEFELKDLLGSSLTLSYTPRPKYYVENDRKAFMAKVFKPK